MTFLWHSRDGNFTMSATCSILYDVWWLQTSYILKLFHIYHGTIQLNSSILPAKIKKNASVRNLSLKKNCRKIHSIRNSYTSHHTHYQSAPTDIFWQCVRSGIFQISWLLCNWNDSSNYHSDAKWSAQHELIPHAHEKAPYCLFSNDVPYVSKY